MRSKWIWASAALIASTMSAQAGFFTGNDLYDFCTSSPPFARGYIMGVTDLNDLNIGVRDQSGQVVVPQKFICIPSGAIAQQATDIACKYLADHPEGRQLSAPIRIIDALVAAWPCAQK